MRSSPVGLTITRIEMRDAIYSSTKVGCESEREEPTKWWVDSTDCTKYEDLTLRTHEKRASGDRLKNIEGLGELCWQELQSHSKLPDSLALKIFAPSSTVISESLQELCCTWIRWDKAIMRSPLEATTWKGKPPHLKPSNPQAYRLLGIAESDWNGLLQGRALPPSGHPMPSGRSWNYIHTGSILI